MKRLSQAIVIVTIMLFASGCSVARVLVPEADAVKYALAKMLGEPDSNGCVLLEVTCLNQALSIKERAQLLALNASLVDPNPATRAIAANQAKAAAKPIAVREAQIEAGKKGVTLTDDDIAEIISEIDKLTVQQVRNATGNLLSLPECSSVQTDPQCK